MWLIGSALLIVLPVCLLYWPSGYLALDLGGWPIGAIGVVLFALGAAIALWAGYNLIQHGEGTPFPLDAPRRLVTTGPYQFVRNPQAIAISTSDKICSTRLAYQFVRNPQAIAMVL